MDKDNDGNLECTIRIVHRANYYKNAPRVICDRKCIFWGGSEYGDCGSTFSPEPYSRYIGCKLNLAINDHSGTRAQPGPNCPGSGIYKLVKIGDIEPEPEPPKMELLEPGSFWVK